MTTKIGRNDRCPCGSGKKFKQCCAGKAPGFAGWIPVRWIASLYRYFLASAENRVRLGNWNRRPGSYDGFLLGPYLQGFAAPLMALVWTCVVLVLGLIGSLSVMYWFARIIGWS